MIQMSPMCYRIICDTYNLAQLISLFMSQSAHTTTHAHAHALYSTHCEETQDKKKNVFSVVVVVGMPTRRTDQTTLCAATTNTPNQQVCLCM